MSDKIEKLENCIFQHGKENNRIYILKWDEVYATKILSYLDTLAQKESYTKIVAKVPIEQQPLLENYEYVKEAQIPYFRNGKDTYAFMCKYFSNDRKQMKEKKLLDDVLQCCKQKSSISYSLSLPNNLLLKQLSAEDIPHMITIYKQVFASYPFPIYEPDYLLQTMHSNVFYFGIYKEGKLVAIASSETDSSYLNCEMTDFATLPEYRGNNYALLLLSFMEQAMKNKHFALAYTIARANSYSMNTTFAKLGYTFGGLLINNTNIGGQIENMNVWYKKLV